MYNATMPLAYVWSIFVYYPANQIKADMRHLHPHTLTHTHTHIHTPTEGEGGRGNGYISHGRKSNYKGLKKDNCVEC